MMKKFMLRVMPIVLVALIVFACPAFAVSEINGTANDKIKTLTGDIWSTIKVVIQILAIAAVVFAGLRYMFASADGKADIKQQTLILVVGAVLVFAAVPVLNFVTSVANNMVK